MRSKKFAISENFALSSGKFDIRIEKVRYEQ
jgi:hypothetical protein